MSIRQVSSDAATLRRCTCGVAAAAAAVTAGAGAAVYSKVSE